MNFFKSKIQFLDLKKFIDHLLINYENKTNTQKISPDLLKGDYSVYSFNSLHSSSVFWLQLLEVLLKNKKKNSKINYLSYAYYPWWLLYNLGSESAVIDKIKKSNINSEFIFFKDLPLTRWGVVLYKQLGINASIRSSSISNENVGINIFDDYILELKYPDLAIKHLRKLFLRYKNTQEIDVKDITNLVHKKYDIKITIFRNKEIADIMYKEITNSKIIFQ
jgi:hypothetical protein